MAKGSQFERDICRKLSLWWTDGADDFVFWRTDQSGGRSTVRHRKGQETKGKCGDICAVDHVGVPFTELVTIECKCGYNSATPLDLIDMPDRKIFPGFIKQCKEARDRAGTPWWMLIHHRARRATMVYAPQSLQESIGPLQETCTFLLKSGRAVDGYKGEYISGWRLDYFLGYPPDLIKIFYKGWKKKKRA